MRTYLHDSDPTTDYNYVLGGGSAPTYTPPDQWTRNTNVPLPGAGTSDNTSVLWLALIGVVIVAVMFGSHR